MTIPTLFFFLYLFIYLFIYSLSKSHYGDKYTKTTKARNLKSGQMISLYMNLRHCNFGGAKLVGYRIYHTNILLNLAY